MRLSTKSRYAVTSLLDLVMHSDKGPVSLADISVRQGISLSYLEQLFAKINHLCQSPDRLASGHPVEMMKPYDAGPA